MFYIACGANSMKNCEPSNNLFVLEPKGDVLMWDVVRVTIICDQNLKNATWEFSI